MAALRTAPSAAGGIADELEKIAMEKKNLERRQQAATGADHNGQFSVTPEVVNAFCVALQPFLKAMGVVDRKSLLSLLGFEATVSDSGEVKASIAVPQAQIVFTTGRTSA